jgi:hypothetical protein
MHSMQPGRAGYCEVRGSQALSNAGAQFYVVDMAAPLCCAGRFDNSPANVIAILYRKSNTQLQQFDPEWAACQSCNSGRNQRYDVTYLKAALADDAF